MSRTPRPSRTILDTTLAVGAAGLFALASLGPAWADNAAIDATTFLREGPGIRYRPMDEALTGSVVEILGCGGGWCRIRYESAVGFVSEGALRTAEPKGVDPATRRCFINQQAGYHGTREMELCASAPAR